MTEPLVRDWMTRGVVACLPDAPVAEVARLMSAHQISAVVVTDQGGLAVGVISQTDLANASYVEPYWSQWRGMAARHLMTSPVVSVSPDTPVASAIALLRERKIRRLVVTEPVLGGQQAVGILSMTDIIARTEVPSRG